MARSPDRRPKSVQGPGVQFRDADLEGWLATQATEGESLGRCAKRLLLEYRSILSTPAAATEADRLRKIRAAVERFGGRL